MMTDLPASELRSVSVIIPNLNYPTLDQVLEALNHQSLEDDVSVEIIVVGQDEPGCLRRFPEVVFIHTPQPVIPAVARNLGIRQARGELLMCLDADCIPHASWLAELIAAHKLQRSRAVIGGSVAIEADNLWVLADNLASFHAYLPTRPPRTYSMLPTCNLSMSRDAFALVGFFDETLPIGEDVDWTMRARQLGFRLYFHPFAQVWHRPQRRTLGAVLRHARDWGYYSIVNRHKYSHLEHLPFIFRRWYTIFLFSPLIALYVTVGIVARNIRAWKYAHVLPIVFGAKLAWCWGAATRLAQGVSF